MLVWTDGHTERAKELARAGMSDRQICIILHVSRRVLMYQRLNLEALRPPALTRQTGERSPPSHSWMARALERAKAHTATEIALAKLEARDPKTPLYKGHSNDERGVSIPSRAPQTADQDQTSTPARDPLLHRLRAQRQIAELREKRPPRDRTPDR